jgi:hypothetical protein
MSASIENMTSKERTVAANIRGTDIIDVDIYMAIQ